MMTESVSYIGNIYATADKRTSLTISYNAMSSVKKKHIGRTVYFVILVCQLCKYFWEASRQEGTEFLKLKLSQIFLSGLRRSLVIHLGFCSNHFTLYSLQSSTIEEILSYLLMTSHSPLSLSFIFFICCYSCFPDCSLYASLELLDWFLCHYSTFHLFLFCLTIL